MAYEREIIATGSFSGVLAFLTETLYLARRSAVCVDCNVNSVSGISDVKSIRSALGTGMYAQDAYSGDTKDHGYAFKSAGLFQTPF